MRRFVEGRLGLCCYRGGVELYSGNYVSPINEKVRTAQSITFTLAMSPSYEVPPPLEYQQRPERRLLQMGTHRVRVLEVVRTDLDPVPHKTLHVDVSENYD